MTHWIRYGLAALLWTAAAAASAQDRHHPFEQEVEYRIEARQDEKTHVLTGRARIRYINHSPDTLHRLWLHQYLNAFRPNSAWSDYDLRFDDRTFQELGPDDHAFERITALTVDGRTVAPVYPGAPDSTVFYIPLPEPLEPGDTVTARIDWRARLATEPRRQGREARHYNWAHWYPRIAVYGADGWEYRAHIRPGELNGTFGSYDVTLDLPADQVVGATGVPVAGDPGWEEAAVAESEPPRYRRDWYGVTDPDPLGLLAAGAASSRKRIRWRAERVHNFAWSASPDYRYLGGRWRDTPIHILWQTDSPHWDAAATLARQKEALDWLAELFGEYPWPQITVTDRVEGGATEYPMLYMTSGGAIVHETMHMVAHGILANNEWREGWLDEGMASFLSDWLSEREEGVDPQMRREMVALARLDVAGQSEPVGLPGAAFSSYRMYVTMTYGKGAAVLRMLRDLLGDGVFREGLRHYYDRYRFRQVSGNDFRRAMEQASGRELDWFFDQWVESTAWLDYRVGDVRLSGEPGRYTLTVEVIREGDAWMPVVVAADGARVVADARDRVQTVTLHTTDRPRRVLLDPDHSLMDPDRINNRARVR